MKTKVPTIIVGVETLAILFQGGMVHLDDATLIPDSVIKNAAQQAMNIAYPPIALPSTSTEAPPFEVILPAEYRKPISQ